MCLVTRILSDMIIMEGVKHEMTRGVWITQILVDTFLTRIVSDMVIVRRMVDDVLMMYETTHGVMNSHILVDLTALRSWTSLSCA